jgi:hypothetical protein
MTSTAARTALLATVLLTAGCAAQAGTGATPAPPPPGGTLPDDGGLVLQVAYTGGFVPPTVTYTQLPLVSIYADGRVITEGPVAAVFPGPALPNLQVARVEPAQVQVLVQHALDAGVGSEFDWGRPPAADAPDTRFTVVTAEGIRTTEVYALDAGLFPDDKGVPGLTDEQTAARARLHELVGELTSVGADSTAYRPEAIAAVAGEDLAPGGSSGHVATWPGPPLPGQELGSGLGLSCVTARGEAADAVLEAAADATGDTVWQNAGGGRWTMTLRPLLPHEGGCDDLGGS